MCLICVEFEMSKITIKEARRNLAEMSEVLDREHIEEINKLLLAKELEQLDDDEFREEYSQVIANGSDSIISIQSTGQTGRHKSQPVHSLAIT